MFLKEYSVSVLKKCSQVYNNIHVDKAGVRPKYFLMYIYNNFILCFQRIHKCERHDLLIKGGTVQVVVKRPCQVLPG